MQALLLMMSQTIQSAGDVMMSLSLHTSHYDAAVHARTHTQMDRYISIYLCRSLGGDKNVTAAQCQVLQNVSTNLHTPSQVTNKHINYTNIHVTDAMINRTIHLS